MAAHPEGHAFNEIWLLFPDTVFPHTFNGIINSEYIIPVNLYGFHSITLTLVRQTAATKLFRHRRA